MRLASAEGRPAEASLIFVLGERTAFPDAALSAAFEAAPGFAEIIVVANGRSALAELDQARWPRARLVLLDEAVPFAAAANRGASLATGHALCFVAAHVLVTNHSLATLVAAVGSGRVACAVPQVVSPDGRLLEAGNVVANCAKAVPLSGDAIGSLEHLYPRPTEGGSSACVCVRRSSFVAAGGFDSGLDTLVAAGAGLSHILQRSGLETRYEPSSRVILNHSTNGEPSPTLAAGAERESIDQVVAIRDAGSSDRILVVTDRVPFADRTHGERRVSQLLTDLAALVPGGRLTLLAFEGNNARRSAPNFLAKGIEVVAGPGDWTRWFERRALLFSHIVVTDMASVRRLEPLLDATQPQARRILCLPSLGFHDSVPVVTSGTPQEETDGIELLKRTAAAQVAQAAESFGVAWCATPHDRNWLEAAAPGITSAVIPTAAAQCADTAFAQRSGYVVLATPGADLTARHEDAALHAASEIFPILLARDSAAFLRIVVDDPSPALQLLVSPHIELVAAGHDPARWFRRSRVCLAWYPKGSGSRDAIMMAIDARTPFVTMPAAVRDHGLGHLPLLVASGDSTAGALRAEQLHSQERAWTEVHGEIGRLADGRRSATGTRMKLLRACADLGIPPKPDAELDEPIEPTVVCDEPTLRLRNVSAVGSAWKAAPPAPDGPLAEPPARVPDAHWSEVPVSDQYERWCARYGPTQLRLSRLVGRLAGLVRRPKISVVMPVFNTEPSWLHEAISSVRNQVYENWELCIGDDGSIQQGTLDVLETHAREEPRIHLVRLPGQQGIVGASNAALSLATGDYVGFLDHDDEIKPHALAEIALVLDDQPTLDVVYTDEDKRDTDGRLGDPFFKPEWSPDHLMSRNYICHLVVLRRSLVEKLGGFRPGYDGSQDYDLILRATELTTRIAHVPEPLYTWRKVPGSTAGDGDAKPWALDAARRALQDAIDRRGTPGEVVDGMHPTTYRVRYAIRGRPKVSVLIPTRDKVDLLRNCIGSILERSTYTNFEILIIDNQSTHPDTLAYLADFPGRVVRYPHRFNYARMMNLAAHEADGDMLLFLNNDTQVVAPEWLEALVEHAQRPEVGVVGPRLLYPSGRPQHEGTIIGHKGGHAGNVDHGGYWGLGDIVRNCSAVTGACLLMRPSVYWEVGGHEERLRIAWNDVDLCLRVRQAGYSVVYTPYAELFHVEGGTRGIHAHLDDDAFFEGRWVTHKCLDPYYNPNLDRLQPFCIRG